MQEADAVEVPEDVQEKLLRFGRAAVAVATMRGKSYLQIGSICMGIGGSIIDPAFIEEYLGMRVESVDEVEILHRIQQDIYDKDEFEKAYKWTREHCPDGLDKNPAEIQKTPEEKEEDWKFVVKTMCIIKDLMNGNDRLPAGREEEMVGHNAIAAGFQGQRQWTDYYPNTDFAEAMLNTTFDWNGAREPYILATENDVLNGLGMLFLKLLTNRAQIFADVRTYCSPEAVKKATGYEVEGVAKEAGGSDHSVLHAAYSGQHAQRTGGEDLPSGILECIRNGQRGTGLSCLRRIWSHVQIERPGRISNGQRLYGCSAAVFRSRNTGRLHREDKRICKFPGSGGTALRKI